MQGKTTWASGKTQDHHTFSQSAFTKCPLSTCVFKGNSICRHPNSPSWQVFYHCTVSFSRKSSLPGKENKRKEWLYQTIHCSGSPQHDKHSSQLNKQLSLFGFNPLPSPCSSIPHHSHIVFLAFYTGKSSGCRLQKAAEERELYFSYFQGSAEQAQVPLLCQFLPITMITEFI